MCALLKGAKVCFASRNVWQRLRRPGTRSISSALNADSSLVKTVSMKGMESRTAVTIISICSRPSAVAATNPSWRTISQLWTRSGIQIASSARSVWTKTSSICQGHYFSHAVVKRFLVPPYARSSINTSTQKFIYLDIWQDGKVNVTFITQDCSKAVKGKSFYAMEGKPVCPKCVGVDEDE